MFSFFSWIHCVNTGVQVDGDNTSWHIGARTIPTPPVDSGMVIFQQGLVEAYRDSDNSAWTIKIPRAIPTPPVDAGMLKFQNLVCFLIALDNDRWTIGVPRAVPDVVCTVPSYSGIRRINASVRSTVITPPGILDLAQLLPPPPSMQVS
jgi:hypothetical protein